MNWVYYNEIDPYCVKWLANLMRKGLIPRGEVDSRPIQEVTGEELNGFTQHHFFTGIAGWPYALRLAGWPDDRPVWTGSCPCPSFSVAGKGEGFADPRHLWPEWFRLIRECCPPVILGEQVDGAIRHGWLDLVQTDLEAEGYAVGAAVLGACGVGAPHRRQRLFFVANAGHGIDAKGAWTAGRIDMEWISERDGSGEDSGAGELGDASGEGLAGWSRERGDDEPQCPPAERAGGPTGLLAHPNGRDTRPEGLQRGREHGQRQEDGGAGGMADTDKGRRGRGTPNAERLLCHWPEDGRNENNGLSGGRGAVCERPGSVNGFWRDADWLLCRDGRWRPTQAGTFPLAASVPGRVGKLRAYGNALCIPVAKAFVRAYMECRP